MQKHVIAALQKHGTNIIQIMCLNTISDQSIADYYKQENQFLFCIKYLQELPSLFPALAYMD